MSHSREKKDFLEEKPTVPSNLLRAVLFCDSLPSSVDQDIYACGAQTVSLPLFPPFKACLPLKIIGFPRAQNAPALPLAGRAGGNRKVFCPAMLLPIFILLF
jgi:hypothetical protein